MNAHEELPHPVASDIEPLGAGDAAAQRSLIDDVRALVNDGRLLAEAEIEFQKKRVSYGAGEAGGIALRFAVAGVLAFFAAMALVMGLVIGLAPLLTIWGSSALVTAALLLGAYLLAQAGRKKLSRVKSVISADTRSDTDGR